MLLPFIEQNALYAGYDHNQPASWSYVYGQYSPGNIAGTPAGLVANGNIVKTKVAAFLCPTDSSNDFFYNSTNQYYSISSTVSGGARTNYDFNNWYGDYYYQGYSYIHLPQEQRAMFHADYCNDMRNGVPPAWGPAGHVQMGIDLQRYPINTWQYGPNSPAYAYMKKVGRLAEWGTAGSLHTGGCNVLLGDGSVKFLSENMDFTLQGRLHTINDGNAIGEF
jgi:prepilin-type processing-associated H-X9-DG protein